MIKTILRRLFGERTIGKAEYVLKPSLKESWGGPLNGQVHRRRIYEDLLERLPLTAIVETGTFRGTTTTLFAASGLPVYTVEASPRFHAYAKLRLRDAERVRLHFGDSRTFLRSLAQNPAVPEEDVFFYLDAHWEEDLPLEEEVEIIFSNWQRAIIMVDDFEVPGTEYDYDDYGPGKALTLDYLRSLATLDLRAYFPSVGPEQETGAKRGCVVLCTDSEVAERLDAIGSLSAGTAVAER